MAEIKFDLFHQKEEYKDAGEIERKLVFEREDRLEAAKTEEEKKAAKDRYALYKKLWEKHPEEFACLYQIEVALREKMKGCMLGEVDGKLAILFKDKKQPHITLMKVGKEGQISGSIAISDQYAAEMKQEDMNRLAMAMGAAGIEPESMHSNNADLARLLEEMKSAIERGEVTQEYLDKVRGQAKGFTGAKAVAYDEAVKEMEKSILRNLRKRSGHESVTGYKGGTYFNLYSRDYGSLTSDERKKTTPDARIFVKKGKDGKPYYLYHTKYNGPINKEVAATMLDALKECKYDSVDLSDILDSDRGAFMTAAAEKGLIPMGIYINPTKANTLIRAASEKLPSEKLEKFKFQLALSMEEYNINHKKGGKDDDLFITSLKDEYRNKPLKDAWEVGGLKRVLADHTRSSDKAEETLAAMYAMNKVLNIYKDFNTIEELLAMPVGAKTSQSPNIVIFDTEEEKRKIVTLFASRKDMLTRNLTSSDMKLMFDRFMGYGMVKAEHDLLEVYEKNEREYTARQFDRTIILSLYNARKNMLTSTTEELRSLGCDIALPTMNQPDTYPKGQAHAKKIKEEMAAEKAKAEREKANPPVVPVVTQRGASR